MAARARLVCSFICLIGITVPGAAGAQTAPSLADLVAKGGSEYTKIGEHTWQTTYRGKTIPTIIVKVGTAEGGVFFFVDLIERDKVPLSKNLLLKIAELNSEYDYVKIAISKTTLVVRLDVRANLLNVEEFRMLEKQAATAADEIYAAIKDFLP